MTDNSKLKQGTPEWHEARRYKITGTSFAKVLSKRGNTRKDYMRQLVLERKTGISTETFSNEAMEWGTRTEPQARAYYEKINGRIVQVGFIEHPLEQYRDYVGVSPDGLWGKDGGIEIKCPNSSTHLEYIAKNVLPVKYKPQVQGTLWVTGRQWCDFISFDPRVKEQPYWCIRIERDQKYINELAVAVDRFIQEMVEMKEEFKDVDPQTLIDVTEGGCTESEWLQAKQVEIKGKCRTLYACAMAQGGKPMEFPGEKFKTDIDYYNRVVEYMLTGE